MSLMSYNSEKEDDVKKWKQTVDIQNIKVDEKVIQTMIRPETDEEKKTRVDKE